MSKKSTKTEVVLSEELAVGDILVGYGDNRVAIDDITYEFSDFGREILQAYSNAGVGSIADMRKLKKQGDVILGVTVQTELGNFGYHSDDLVMIKKRS